MRRPLTQNSLVLLLLIILSICQTISFMTIYQQDKIIRDLVNGHSSLWELVRLQNKLEELRRGEPKASPHAFEVET